MSDDINVIRNAINDELNAKTGAGQDFQRFTIYKFRNDMTGWKVPCIEMDLKVSPAMDYMLGDERINYLLIDYSLTFKHNHRRTIDSTTYETDDLAQWYATQLEETLTTMSFPSTVSVSENIITGGAHKEIDNVNKYYIYGCVISQQIGYKIGN